MSFIVEVVCTTADQCESAWRAGANRIEICAAIELDGLTPSKGLVTQASRTVPLPLMAMIRPRPGDFVYSKAEVETMLRDIEALDEVQGLVFGALTSEGRVDEAICARLIRACGNRETVFHRAFDAATDPINALESIIGLGFTRILTSGQAPSAYQGISTLQRLRERAANRIQILPGGGIRSSEAEIFRSAGWSALHVGPRPPEELAALIEGFAS